jgi:capsid protein
VAYGNQAYPRPKTVSAGELWSLKAGEDVKFLQPTNPNNTFADYIRSQTGMVSSAIGIPLQVLSCNYDGTYASARGSVLEANRQFKRYRGFFIEKFIKPIFEQFVYDLTGDIQTAVEYSVLSQWQAPTALCLDPTKEIDAWAKAIQLGLCDRDEAAQALYGHKATGTPEKPDKTVEVEEL